MKAVGVSDFALKARGKLAAMMHVTNAKIFVLKFKKLFLFCFSGSAVGLLEPMTGTLIFTSIVQIPTQVESAVVCHSLAVLKTLLKMLLILSVATMQGKNQKLISRLLSTLKAVSLSLRNGCRTTLP